MTENPYYEQATHHGAYKRIDKRAKKALLSVIEPDEEAISSIGCNHGQWNPGQLVTTDKRLLFVRIIPPRGFEEWPLTLPLQMRHQFPPIAMLATGELFQGPLNPRPLKEFVQLHQLMMRSIRWEQDHAELAPVPVVIAGNAGLGEELTKLEALLNSGRLTEAEFETAKQRLLSV